MTTQSEVVRQSDLLNQLVLDRTTMEELGRIETLWMYVPAHRVLGFICKSGFLGSQKSAFNLSQIHTFGKTSILASSKPQETDAEKVRQLESLVHSEVWSDTGNRIGKITDYCFDLKTGIVTDYLFVTGELSALTEGVYRLPPSKILSLGRKRVLVAESAVRSLALYREGIKQKLRKAEEVIKEDYTQVTQELKSFTQQARSLADLARERAQHLADQAREKAQALNEQLKEGTHTLVEQVKEQTQVIREQLADAEDEPDAVEAIDDDFDAIFADWDTEPTPAAATPASAPQDTVKPPDSPSQATAATEEDWDTEWATPVRTAIVEPLDEDFDFDDDFWGPDISASPAPEPATVDVSATVVASDTVVSPEPGVSPEPALVAPDPAMPVAPESTIATSDTEQAASAASPTPCPADEDDEPWV